MPVARPNDGSDIDVLIVSSDLRAWNTRERMEQLALLPHVSGSLSRPWLGTPAELVHVEPATLLEEILQTGVQSFVPCAVNTSGFRVQ